MAETAIDCDFAVLTSRLTEVQITRGQEFPTGSVPVRTMAEIGVEASPGRIEARNNSFAVAVKLVLRLRFVDEPPKGDEFYAAIDMTLNAVMEADRVVDQDVAEIRIVEPTLGRVSQLMLATADGYVRQLMTMARFPLVFASEQLVDALRRGEPQKSG
jgi:hypothetical protein